MPLLLAGVGVWALVIGPFCGNLAAIARRLARLAVPAAAAPRPRRGAALPALLVAGVRHRRRSRCSSRRGRSRCSGIDDGLAAAGWITLAATLTRYADRADQILATTIYPAIVRVRDRVDVLEELFAKANRLTLMWAFPFGAGLALFGADLIVFVLGDEWRGAIVLLGGLAVAVALQQVGYSWFAFYRARGESWPQAVESVVLRRRRSSCSRSRARCSAARGGSWSGGSACTVCVLAVRARLRAAAAAGRAAAALGRAGGGAGRARVGAGARAAARAVGRRADAAAGAAGAGAVARRARARHPPARGRAARRAARLPARGRPA